MKVFPVVHINEVDIATRQAELALETGADGVYLIDHKTTSYVPTMAVFERIRASVPSAFVGLNFLNDTPLQAFEYLGDFSSLSTNLARDLPEGLWVDDCNQNKIQVLDFREVRPDIAQRVKYAGGVAFKYTPTFTEDPQRAAAEAAKLKDFVDVVVTSGPGTGSPANPEKIIAMKEAIGDKPLAVASGVTPDNVGEFAAADQVFVATGIETAKYSGIFIPDELRRMIEAAHAL